MRYLLGGSAVSVVEPRDRVWVGSHALVVRKWDEGHRVDEAEHSRGIDECVPSQSVSNFVGGLLWSLYGLLEALRAQGKVAEADQVQAQLRSTGASADVILTGSRF